jgi:hypothetical protein
MIQTKIKATYAIINGVVVLIPHALEYDMK